MQTLLCLGQDVPRGPFGEWHIHIYGTEGPLLLSGGELTVQAPPTGTSIVPALAESREVAP